MSNILECIDGVCGSGKSHNVIKYIVQNILKERFIIALPTIDMVMQTYKNIEDGLEEAGHESTYLISAYTSATSDSVISEIQGFLNTGNPRCIIITHKALEIFCYMWEVGAMSEKESYLKDLSECSIFCDEVPNPIITGEHEFSLIGEDTQSGWLRAFDEIQPIPKGEEVLTSFLTLKKETSSEGKIIHIPKYKKLVRSVANDRKTYQEEVNNLAFIALNNAPLFKIPVGNREARSGFRLVGVTASPLCNLIKRVKHFYLMAANASISSFAVVAREWKKIETVSAPEYLQPEPDRRDHPIDLQKQVMCHYLLEKRTSKEQLKKCWPDVLNKVCEIFAGDEFIYSTNSDGGFQGYNFAEDALKAFKRAKKATGLEAVRIRYFSNGINIFGGEKVHNNRFTNNFGLTPEQIKKGFFNAVWLGVSRLKPDFKRFIGNDTIVKAIETQNSWEAAYQMVCRSAFRYQVAEPGQTFNFLFIDKPTMEYFRDKYAPDSHIGIQGCIKSPSKRDENKEGVIEILREWRKEYPNLSQIKLLKVIKEAGNNTISHHSIKTYWKQAEPN